jgi:hypothetical protein
MAMISALLVLFLIAPLVMGLAFAIKYQHRLRKPVWSCLAVVAEGYGLALVVSMAFGATSLSRIGLSGVPSQGGDSQFDHLGLTVALAFATLVVLNVALLWWNLRVLPKRP